MAETVASKNRRMRQENLRDQLEAGGHIQYVVEIAKKLTEPEEALETTDIQRLKAAADIHLKLVGKFLPDLKSIEHSGTIGTEDAAELTDAELLNIATASRTGTTKQANSKKVTH